MHQLYQCITMYGVSIIHIQFLVKFHSCLENWLPNKMTVQLIQLWSLPINLFLLFSKSAIQFGELLKNSMLI